MKLSEIFQNVYIYKIHLFWSDSSEVSLFIINFKQIFATKEIGTKN